MKFVGIDLHKKTIVVCVVGQDRKVSGRRTLHCHDEDGIVRYFREPGEFQAAVEARQVMNGWPS